MIHKFILILFFLIIYQISNCQTCIYGALTLNSQSEVDEFANNYPGCVEVLGNLIITDGVNNLEGLNQLESINGLLSIKETTNLLKLNGLENLSYVGELNIKDNNSLISLSGINNLTIVDGDFDLINNPLIPNFNGLNSLESILGDFWIFNNDALLNFEGLENLSSITGYDFFISDNENLINFFGLLGITNLIGDVTIRNNNSLSDFMGLDSLNNIDRKLIIDENQTLNGFMGFYNLDSVEYLIVKNNQSILSFEGFSSLKYIEKQLIIENNINLNNILGFSTLNQVGSGIWLDNNPSLQNLDYFPPSLDSLNFILLENNDSLTNLEGLLVLSKLNGLQIKENDVLLNLSGLENITSLKNLCVVKDNLLLESLKGLENVEEISNSLWIENNQSLQNLLDLGSLNIVSERLTIKNNNNLININGLENLQLVNEVLIDGNDQLENLQGLNQLDTVGSLFTISNNSNLTTLNFSNLNHVKGDLRISSNHALINLNGFQNLKSINEDLWLTDNSSLIDLSGFDSLKYIGGRLRITLCDTLQSLNGLENLEIVGGTIGDFRITSNPYLSNISAIKNIDLSNITDLHVKGNSNLSICGFPSICNYLESPNDYSISNNYNGCNTLEEILFNCENNLSKIYYNIFYDLNSNGEFDLTDVLMQNSSITLNPGQNDYYSSNSLQNNFVFVENGNYQMILDTSILSNWLLTTDSFLYNINIETIASSDTINFGLFPEIFNSDLKTYINGPPARCGELKEFDISVKNLGTTTSSGFLYLDILDNVSSFEFIDNPDTILSDGSFGWFFQDLYPGNIISKSIKLEIPVPPDVILGDSIHISSNAFYTDTIGSNFTETFNYTSEIRCSFDPNDKLVHPSREGNQILLGEDLFYTIRFQNTGNDSAYNIVVRDTLDAHLSLSSFRLVSSSHIENLSIIINNDNNIIFNFNNIYLPDSTTNFEQSQGYVSFIISPKTDLPEGTIIENNASIYFDFNPPIVTNTTMSILVSDLVSINDELFDSDKIHFNIFPNPTRNNVYVDSRFKEEINFEILSLNGVKIKGGYISETSKSINVSDLDPGFYLIKLFSKKNKISIIKKLLIF